MSEREIPNPDDFNFDENNKLLSQIFSDQNKEFDPKDTLITQLIVNSFIENNKPDNPTIFIGATDFELERQEQTFRFNRPSPEDDLRESFKFNRELNLRRNLPELSGATPGSRVADYIGFTNNLIETGLSQLGGATVPDQVQKQYVNRLLKHAPSLNAGKDTVKILEKIQKTIPTLFQDDLTGRYADLVEIFSSPTVLNNLLNELTTNPDNTLLAQETLLMALRVRRDLVELAGNPEVGVMGFDELLRHLRVIKNRENLSAFDIASFPGALMVDVDQFYPQAIGQTNLLPQQQYLEDIKEIRSIVRQNPVTIYESQARFRQIGKLLSVSKREVDLAYQAIDSEVQEKLGVARTALRDQSIFGEKIEIAKQIRSLFKYALDDIQVQSGDQQSREAGIQAKFLENKLSGYLNDALDQTTDPLAHYLVSFMKQLCVEEVQIQSERAVVPAETKMQRLLMHMVVKNEKTGDKLDPRYVDEDDGINEVLRLMYRDPQKRREWINLRNRVQQQKRQALIDRFSQKDSNGEFINYDFVMVGTGPHVASSVAELRAAGFSVLVVDKQARVAGNWGNAVHSLNSSAVERDPFGGSRVPFGDGATTDAIHSRDSRGISLGEFAADDDTVIIENCDDGTSRNIPRGTAWGAVIHNQIFSADPDILTQVEFLRSESDVDTSQKQIVIRDINTGREYVINVTKEMILATGPGDESKNRGVKVEFELGQASTQELIQAFRVATGQVIEQQNQKSLQIYLDVLTNLKVLNLPQLRELQQIWYESGLPEEFNPFRFLNYSKVGVAGSGDTSKVLQIWAGEYGLESDEIVAFDPKAKSADPKEYSQTKRPVYRTQDEETGLVTRLSVEKKRVGRILVDESGVTVVSADGKEFPNFSLVLIGTGLQPNPIRNRIVRDRFFNDRFPGGKTRTGDIVIGPAIGIVDSIVAELERFVPTASDENPVAYWANYSATQRAILKIIQKHGVNKDELIKLVDGYI